MNSDSYFEIGSTHSVCQDYALSGVFADLHYAIVSDGCSSSQHSEIGAQIYCHVAKYFLLLYHNTSVLESLNTEGLRRLLQTSIYKRAEELCVLYGLDFSALDATLLITFTIGKKTIVFCWGDGVIVQNYEDRLIIYDIEYESNAPFYLPNYKRQRRKSYEQTFGDSSLILKMSVCEGSKEIHFVETKHHYSESPTFETNSTDDDPLKSILIASDGMGSYQNPDRAIIPVTEIAPQLLGYKRTTGRFVESNMNFMKRRHQKEGISHFDDVSCGIVVR